MSFLTAFFGQQATWWKKTGIDGYGQSTFAVPAVLPVRWEGATELIINPEGFQVPSRAKVFLGRALVVGDYLFLGVSVVTDPRSVVGAYPILSIKNTPGLADDLTEQRAYL